MLDTKELEDNPDLTGEYNVARAITTFNKHFFLIALTETTTNSLSDI
jgi:hypothetical protein